MIANLIVCGFSLKTVAMEMTETEVKHAPHFQSTLLPSGKIKKSSIAKRLSYLIGQFVLSLGKIRNL
jgi:hypothetical protein